MSGCASGRWVCLPLLSVLAAVSAGRADDAALNRPGRGTLTGSLRGNAAPIARSARARAITDDGVPRAMDSSATSEPEGGVAGGVGVVCAEAGDPDNCQLPNQQSNGGAIGITSDANPASGFAAADNFVLTAGGSVHSVCWWGFYADFGLQADCGPGAVPDQFTITYYANDPGCPDGAPGTVIAGPFQVSPAKAPTGNVIPSNFGDLTEFEYAAAHPPVSVPAGQCTWIGIQNDTSPSSCFWLWSTAPPGDGDSHEFNALFPDNDFDLAFCLNLALDEIGATCVPPSLLVCDVASSADCGTAHATPGCNVACCCTAVCTGLPDCCIIEWDAACVAAAIDAGCAVAGPCQDAVNCQVYGDLSGYNSTTSAFLAADDFTVAASGPVTTICWEGAYADGEVTDSFRVRYFADDEGLPGMLLATFSQAAATLQGFSRTATGRVVQGTKLGIFRYTATHAPVAVTAGSCYWIEISNNLAPGATWFWSWAEEGRNQSQPDETLPREGNGRMLLDGTPPDGYDTSDRLADADMAFCLGRVLAATACGFETLFDTGPHESVLSNGLPAHLGWSSGNLDNGANAHRRAAQPFWLPHSADEWEIEQIGVEGFVPVGAVTDFVNIEIWTRSALDAPPVPGTSVAQLFNVPFSAAQNIDETTERLVLLLPPGDLTLAPGDYWLTVFGSNGQAPFVASNFAWFSNAPDGINNVCTAAMPPPPPGSSGCQPSPGGAPSGTPAMLRASTYPVPGFGAYTLPPSALDVDPVDDPTPDPADLYNAAILIRGRAIGAAFSPPQTFTAADEPVIHVVADLDLNGTVDAAVVMPADDPEITGRAQVFRNLGDGPGGWLGLLANPPITVGREPSGVAAGLFNDDPHPDLAITNAGDDNVTILINTGTGNASYSFFTNVTVGDRPSAVVAEDFNEDSFTDLAVTNENDDNLVILLGNGTGNFVPAAGAAPIFVGNAPRAMSSGDFDNNKCPDLAGGGAGAALGLGPANGQAFVLLGQPGGGFSGPFFFNVGADPNDLATDDLDGDGLNDIVTADTGSNTLSVLLNQGGGAFAPALTLPVGTQPLSVEAFELDNVLDPDLALVAEVGGTRVVQVLQNPLGGPFTVSFAVPVGGDANFVVKGLFNNDGLEDLVTVNADNGPTGGSVSVLLNSPSTGNPVCPWDCGNGDGSVGTADFLALLGQWFQVGTSCDFDDNGVNTLDFLALLQHWGACP